MKITSLSSPAVAIGLVTAAIFAVSTFAQAPPAPQGPPPGPGGAMRMFAPPVNLKVLPKDTTSQQVHEIMDHWAGDLGVHCDTCHAADPNNVGPNGRPRLKFDDDSKDEKQMARIMYKMTEDMKANYIKKVADMDKMGSPAAPLTCGTCHRGHLDPEAFAAPQEERRGPGGPPPAGAMPPMQH